MSVKKYYYIDSSILYEEDFYTVIEHFLNEKREVAFVLDSSIRDEIESERRLGEWERARLLESYLDLFSLLEHSLEVDTAKGFDPAPLADMAASELVVLTQRRNPVDNFASLAGNITFLHLVDGHLAPFVRDISENGNAFYVEEDHYLDRFDIDAIEYVFSPRYGYLRLDKSREYAGGEGVCYRTYHNLFCKLYFKDHMTYVNFKRLQTMVEMGCTMPNIAWPLDLLYHNNRFVGYVMHELNDVRSLDELRDDNFSGFRILDRFIIARNFLRIIEYLHRRNILVGDMKLDNIMVERDASVHIIDAGSFQVEDYPCDVCHKEYTELIYMEDDLKKILRSVREEYFPINKILFEILMMKGPFYSKENAEIDGDGSREFTYPMTPPEQGEQLPYHLRVWYALSPSMRQFFYRYFTQGKITYVSEWLRELDVYILEKQRAAARRADT